MKVFIASNDMSSVVCSDCSKSFTPGDVVVGFSVLDKDLSTTISTFIIVSSFHFSKISIGRKLHTPTYNDGYRHDHCQLDNCRSTRKQVWSFDGFKDLPESDKVRTLLLVPAKFLKSHAPLPIQNLIKSRHENSSNDLLHNRVSSSTPSLTIVSPILTNKKPDMLLSSSNTSTPNVYNDFHSWYDDHSKSSWQPLYHENRCEDFNISAYHDRMIQEQEEALYLAAQNVLTTPTTTVKKRKCPINTTKFATSGKRKDTVLYTFS